MTRRPPVEFWLIASLLLGVLPQLTGWLPSYGLDFTVLALATACTGLTSLAAVLVWAVSARAEGAGPIFVAVGISIWGLAIVGAWKVDTWLAYKLWNPAWSKPFMMDTYAASAGLIGALLWGAAAVLVFVFRLRRNFANG